MCVAKKPFLGQHSSLDMFALGGRGGDDDDISSRLLSPLIHRRPASEEEEEGRGTIKTLFPGSKKKDDSGAGNNTKSVDL